MQILHTLPRQDGFAMPAEFQRHDGCLMIWPERGDSWRNGAWPARKAFCAVASAIAQTEKLTMLVSAAQYETARAMLPPAVRLAETRGHGMSAPPLSAMRRENFAALTGALMRGAV